MLEASLVARLEEDFQTRSWTTFEEVPFLQRRIDLVAVEPLTNLVVAVEAKVKNWRVAVRQALSCLLCCDYVFIALPENRIRAVDVDHLKELGIGLLSVGGDVARVLEPPASLMKDPYHAQWMRETLRMIQSDLDETKE